MQKLDDLFFVGMQPLHALLMELSIQDQGRAHGFFVDIKGHVVGSDGTESGIGQNAQLPVGLQNGIMDVGDIRIPRDTQLFGQIV